MTKESLMKWGIAILILIICLLLILLFMRHETKDEGSGIGLTFDPYSGTFVAPEKAETEDKPGIAIPGWGSIAIPSGETVVDVNLENPTDNEDRYNLSFSIYLKDEDAPIAQTGLIRPGSSALKLRLEKALEAGHYDAVVLVQPYRVADGSMTNNAQIETILIVE